MQNEITSPGKLLDKEGKLILSGYSKKMLLEYNRNDIKSSSWRIKEWDYYLIYNSNYAIALTIADISYLTLISATIIDFTKGKEITSSKTQFLTFGKTNLPSSSLKGDIHYTTADCSVHFTINNDKTRRLLFTMKNFSSTDIWNNKNTQMDFSLDIILSNEPDESIVISTPFDKEKFFYYNQKIVGFSVSGKAKIGDNKFNFDSKDTFGLLDWGRGVWTYKNTWYWSSLCGVSGGVKIGWSVGYGFGDTSKATENMVFYNGKGHKLDKVNFNIPKDNYLKPWILGSNDGRFYMEFLPIIDRKKMINIGIICTDQHQVFGVFNGYYKLDSGEKVRIENMLGFAEKVYNRW